MCVPVRFVLPGAWLDTNGMMHASSAVAQHNRLDIEFSCPLPAVKTFRNPSLLKMVGKRWELIKSLLPGSTTNDHSSTSVCGDGTHAIPNL